MCVKLGTQGRTERPRRHHLHNLLHHALANERLHIGAPQIVRRVALQVHVTTISKNFSATLQHANFNHQFFWWAHILYTIIQNKKKRKKKRKKKKAKLPKKKKKQERALDQHNDEKVTQASQNDDNNNSMNIDSTRKKSNARSSNPTQSPAGTVLKSCCKRRRTLSPKQTFDLAFHWENLFQPPIVPSQCAAHARGRKQLRTVYCVGLPPDARWQRQPVACPSCPRLLPDSQ